MSPPFAQEEEALDEKIEEEVEEEVAEELDEARERAATERAMREAEDRLARERALREAEAQRAQHRAHHAAPPLQFRVLATTTIPVSIGDLDPSGDLLVGLRGELDFGHVSALFSWDRGASSIFDWDDTVIPTSYWNGLIGPSVLASRHNRIRLLGGVSAISISERVTAVVPSDGGEPSTVTLDRGVTLGPTLGATARIGTPFIGLEGAFLFTAVGFRQVDARVEAVLRLFIFEARGGFRARWVDSYRGDRVPVESVYGPTVSLGLSF